MLTEFECPTCQARYKVVRLSSGAQVTDQIHCKVCKQPLAPTDDGQILKYFRAITDLPALLRG